MMKAFSRVLLVSCLIAAVVCQDDVGDSSAERPRDGEGHQIPNDSCVFWGDPHIWTFDSAMYSYQDPGWHHIIISPTLNIQANFVAGCYTPIPTNACAKDLRMFVLDEDNTVNFVEVYLSDTAQTGYTQVFQGSEYYQILINGKDSRLYSQYNASTNQITYPGVQPNFQVPIGTSSVGYYYLPQNNLFQLKFIFQNDVVIGHIPNVLTITPSQTGNQIQQNSLWNNICGLCGTFNGWNGDDFQLHQNPNKQIPLSNENIPKFANTWSVDYVPTGYSAPNNGGTEAVFTCNFAPNPTPSPTPSPSPPTNAPPTPTRAPPTTTPTTPAPTPSHTPAPTSPAPSPTPSQTPAPTNPPTATPTPSPTYPPTQPPTNPPTTTPAPTPTLPSNKTTNGTYINVDNTTAITNAQGTPIWFQANQSCANAGIVQGNPLWANCMYDVTQTNTTTIAVASAGALVLAGCAKTNLTDSSCVANTLFACPAACNAAGACVGGVCKCNKGYSGTTCTPNALLTPAELAAVISAGAVAGIAIGAAAFLGLAGFGAKKGYDYYHMNDNKMANVNSNPLYAEKNTGGVSPLYADKA